MHKGDRYFRGEKKNISRMENNLENIEIVRAELTEVSYTSMETLVL